MRFILAGLGLAAFASGAASQNVYKYTDPSGRVIYTDDPTAGHGTAKRVEVPALPAEKPAAGLSENEKNLLEQANRRAAELDRATADIVTAFDAVRAAEVRQEQGVESREGERSGRLYRPEYWERQQALKRDVDDARTKLDDALTRRNALR